MTETTPQVGEYWRMRGSNRIVGPLKDTGDEHYPLKDQSAGYLYKADGRYVNSGEDHPRDLISRVHLLTDAEHAEWEAGKKYDAQLAECCEVLNRWPLASGCNGHLCVARHLKNILDALERAEQTLSDTRSAAGNGFPADWSLPRIVATLRQKVNERVLRPAKLKQAKGEFDEVCSAAGLDDAVRRTLVNKFAELFAGIPTEEPDHSPDASKMVAADDEEPISPGLQRQFRKAAHDIGSLFTWSVQNLKKFPPPPGKEWLDEIKERLLAGARSTDDIAGLKQVIELDKVRIGQLEAEIRVLKELTSPTSLESPTPPVPEVIVGKDNQGQLTASQAGFYAFKDSHGVGVCEKTAGSWFEPHCDYIKLTLPEFPPPRPTFTAPPKPEQVLVRNRNGESYWCERKSGGLWVDGTRIEESLVEQINEMGEVVHG